MPKCSYNGKSVFPFNFYFISDFVEKNQSKYIKEEEVSWGYIPEYQKEEVKEALEKYDKKKEPTKIIIFLKWVEIRLKIIYQKYEIPIIIAMTPTFLALTILGYQRAYIELNYWTRPVQTVTVSSEGPAAEMYPDSMGQYNLLRDVYRYDRAVYKHVDRENRFIIFAGRNEMFY